MAQNQDIFHILVDGSNHMTYVAQSNLKPSNNRRDSFDHPLLSFFFDQTSDGRYIRNQNSIEDLK